MDQEQEFLQSLSGLRDQLLDVLKDYWIFSIPYSLGEVAIAGALAKSFKQQYGGPLAFLVDPAKMGVAQLFQTRWTWLFLCRCTCSEISIDGVSFLRRHFAGEVSRTSSSFMAPNSTSCRSSRFAISIQTAVCR